MRGALAGSCENLICSQRRPSAERSRASFRAGRASSSIGPKVAALHKPAEVFLSYAREDEGLADELLKHLAPLVRAQRITAWHRRMTPAGAPQQSAIEEHLNQSEIILLLVSADYLASDERVE